MTTVRQQRRKTTRLVLLLASLSLGACGGESSDPASTEDKTPALTAATLGEQQVLTTAEYLALPQYAGADLKKGEQQAQICKACHSLDKGGANMIGPALHGFFGQPAGAVEGFGYSPVLQNAEFVWTPRALDAWLLQPGSFLPGNRMTFGGVPRKESRDALIAYLLQQTQSE